MLRMIQVGMGPLGRRMVCEAASRGLRVMAAVDPAAKSVGADVADLCGLATGRHLLGPIDGPGDGSPLTVTETLTALPPAVVAAADIAVLTTYSDLARVAGQVTQLTTRGLPVVSTCEELSYPWMDHSDEAAALDAACRRDGVACLGTGVNPGFLMDYLPSVLSGLCREVRGVTVHRIQDAAPRRIPFQEKIGAGLSLREFEHRRQAGRLRHVGLPESVHMLAAACGWRLTHVEETLAPVVAEERIESGHRPVAPGQAAGVEQWARGYIDRDGGSQEVITLHFRAAVGQADPRDEVRIDGEPMVRSVIAGGVDGDAATCAVTLNAAPVVAAAAPGLHTMLDLPIPTVGR